MFVYSLICKSKFFFKLEFDGNENKIFDAANHLK